MAVMTAGICRGHSATDDQIWSQCVLHTPNVLFTDSFSCWWRIFWHRVHANSKCKQYQSEHTACWFLEGCVVSLFCHSFELSMMNNRFCRPSRSHACVQFCIYKIQTKNDLTHTNLAWMQLHMEYIDTTADSFRHTHIYSVSQILYISGVPDFLA